MVGNRQLMPTESTVRYTLPFCNAACLGKNNDLTAVGGVAAHWYEHAFDAAVV